jgi:hypothetical protein
MAAPIENTLERAARAARLFFTYRCPPGQPGGIGRQYIAAFTQQAIVKPHVSRETEIPPFTEIGCFQHAEMHVTQVTRIADKIRRILCPLAFKRITGRVGIGSHTE